MQTRLLVDVNNKCNNDKLTSLYDLCRWSSGMTATIGEIGEGEQADPEAHVPVVNISFKYYSWIKKSALL